MKFGINLNEASTRHGFIKVLTFTIGLIMIWTGHGSISELLMLSAGIEGGAKIFMPDNQSVGD